MPQITGFSKTIGLDTLKDRAQRTALHVRVVLVQDAIWKETALALVIVIEPLPVVNANAGPLADSDSTSWEWLRILRTKYTVSAATPPKKLPLLLAKTTASGTTKALTLEQVKAYVGAELLVH